MPFKFKITGKQLFIVWLVCLMLLALPAFAAAEEEEYWELSDSQLQWLEIHELLQSFHVTSPSGEKLAGVSIEAMLEALNDPYSRYMTPDEWDNYLNSLNQKFTGIGVLVAEEDEGMRIVEVYPNSPAAEAGLLAGDYLVAIDGVTAGDREIDSFLSLIPKEDGSSVILTLDRSGQIVEVELFVGEIVVPSVSGFLMNDGTGYIYISVFASETSQEFTEMLNQLSAQGMKALILDIRNNPGGLADSVHELSASFIPEGVLMTVQDGSGYQEDIEIIGGSELSVPVALLVNGESASAAEVLAGFLQDYEKAVLIGSRTYGKGTIQSMIPLSNGGVLKMSTEQYFTPMGHPVQGQGIIPDWEVEGELPQLLAALHALDSAVELDIRFTGELIVNGEEIGYEAPFLNREEKWYVHSRILAAMVGNDIGWHGALGSVVLTSLPDRQVIVFHTGESVILEQDLAYVELEAFQQVFPQFHWKVNDGGLVLTVRP
ncbi:S41 family peptidase [Paenibacillus senegalensis]|uniref:S41 family peptidase n=1 Tax=Paenibacillus senegalensis TaxID=1465766 RepID=UPI000287C114|nr:S41 family peptidase [Paenibacillus senegalensis]